jgi:hypothetical protein
MAEAIGKHASDSVLAHLMHSHDTAVRNPKNELVHLYEIRDALVKHFRNDAATRAALGISKHASESSRPALQRRTVAAGTP